MECLRNNNECKKCLDLAVVAFKSTYVDMHPDQPLITADLIAENSKISAVIQEQGPLEMLKCSERMERARRIGHELGRSIR